MHVSGFVKVTYSAGQFIDQVSSEVFSELIQNSQSKIGFRIGFASTNLVTDIFLKDLKFMPLCKHDQLEECNAEILSFPRERKPIYQLSGLFLLSVSRRAYQQKKLQGSFQYNINSCKAVYFSILNNPNKTAHLINERMQDINKEIYRIR